MCTSVIHTRADADRIEHMFEWSGDQHSTPVRPAAVTTAELHDWLAGLAVIEEDVSDDERIEQLRGLEGLKAAAQVRVTAALDESVRAERAARGVPASERARGIAAQVALARRSPPRLSLEHWSTRCHTPWRR
jgi:hypothetical protein